jgi:hypothetical protein
MGGKSRKAGGVSKKLIDRLKAGNYSTGKKPIKVPKDEDKAGDQPLFNTGKKV